MSEPPDYINKYIKKSLLPLIEQDGFKLFKPKLAIRLEKPFVDCISFQMSQYGSKAFYLHYYRNLISNPLLDIDSYLVGDRLSNNSLNGDNVDWIGDTNEKAEKAINSVQNTYLNTIRPWYESIKSVSDYVFEIAATTNHQEFKRLEDAVAFALGGKQERAWWVCSDIINNENQNADKREIYACKELIDIHELESQSKMNSGNTDPKILEALSVLPRSGEGTISDLLEVWSDRNIKALKLEIE